MISARISLPAPFGPVTSTGTSARATCVAICTTRVHRRAAIDDAAQVEVRRQLARASGRRVACRSRSAASTACSCSRLRTVVTSRALSHGFAR